MPDGNAVPSAVRRPLSFASALCRVGRKERAAALRLPAIYQLPEVAEKGASLGTARASSSSFGVTPVLCP